MILQDATPAKSALKTFDDAKEPFKRIIDNYPTNALVPSAWGRVGDCYLQMASVDIKFYENAVAAYQAAMTHPKADIRVRSLAEFGLGKALELQARQANTADGETLFRNAFDHYQAIISGKNLNIAAGERIDLPCYRMVAIEAARLAEERKQWQVAVNIYKDLIQAVPAIRESVERKMQRAMEQLTF
jgi:tetratricopeptide (TPR) repeat protein